MTKTVDELIEAAIAALESRNFDLLVNTVETEHIEAKEMPYQLSASDAARAELAKDVSALSNAGGGIILIGFKTTKEQNSSQDKITTVNPFPLEQFDEKQYRDVLNDWIYPPIHCLEIKKYPSLPDTSRGVAAIIAPQKVLQGQPYLAAHTHLSSGRKSGTLIGYYQRVSGGIIPTPNKTNPQWLQGLLKDGLRFRDISQQLVTIEKQIANLPYPEQRSLHALEGEQLGLSHQEIRRRIDEALGAVERTAAPSIILAVSSDNPTYFPRLFHSESEQTVRDLNDPPMRKDGFAIGNHLSGPSTIVRGELYRRLTPGLQIIDLWQDGLLVGVGEGDYDLLCWWTRYPYNPAETEHNSLRIRNFVLAEVTLRFLELAVKVFEQVEPAPQQLTFRLSLENMAVDGQPCELSPVADNAPNWELRARYRSAQGTPVGSSCSTPFVGIDTGIVAHGLLGGLYAKFGFTYSEMPYVVSDQTGMKRITLKSIMPKTP